MYAYCLFCETQRCKIIASQLEARGIHRAFSPQIIQRHRKQGQNVEKAFDLLPGYVFVYTEEEWRDFSVLSGIVGVHRRLGYADDDRGLRDADYDFAMNLYKKDGVIGTVRAFRVGATVRVNDPLFSGAEGRVTQVDYRKERLRIDYSFAGMACFTWIAFDLAESGSETEMT